MAEAVKAKAKNSPEMQPTVKANDVSWFLNAIKRRRGLTA
jgi:hypothetical protein